MNRFLTHIFFVFALLASAVVSGNAACPTNAPTVIEVCNDAGGNGIIRAYFYNGDPALSYYLFSLTTGEFVGPAPLGPVTANTAIPLPPGAVAGVEFGSVPDGDYIIRVNCSPSGTTNIGGLGINVNAADAIDVTATVDADCNPATGGVNADGSITLTLSGGSAPYDIAWPVAETPIPSSNNVGAGSHVFSNLDGGAYTANITDATNCVFIINITVPLVTPANAGADMAVCGPAANLNGNTPSASEIGTWTGPPGVTFSPDANTPNAVASNLGTGVNTLTWTITDVGGTCAGVSDQVDVTSDPLPTVDAGTPQAICIGATASLAGTIGGSASSATWTTSGDGTFDNASSLTATYTPGAGDIGAGTATLTLTTNDPAGPCASVNDNVVITIEPAATADAGAPQTICAGGTVTLAGAFGGAATSATWTTSGDGSFSDATSPTAVYTPGTTDVSNGTVTLTFTTDDPPGACLPANDNVVITIDAQPIVDAGAPQTICSGSTVTLAGTIGGSASSATWTTSGDGTFNDATSLTAIYTPGTADRGAGSATLTLTSNDPTGPCASSNDNVVITIDAGATVDAGSPQTICAGETVTLAGTFGGSATGATWTTSGDGSFNDATSTGAIYTPGATDVTNGSATLTFTTNDPAGPCLAVNDNVLITIDPTPIVDAGAPQTICSGSTVTLAGSIGGSASSASWTSSGDGTFNDATSLTATYTPGAGDRGAGSVTLTLTTNDPTGPCAALNDNVVITIDAGATVDAGTPQTICAGGTATLTGSFGNGATSATWTTSGDGSFNDPTSTGAIYTPGATDISNGSVTLTFTTDDPAGPCLPVNDNVVITIDAAPVVDAGTPQTICSGSVVTVAGTIGGSASSATWTTSGDGTFDDATSLTATYTPGAGDSGTGSVTLILTTNDPSGSCGSANDNVLITIDPEATVDAGATQTICAGGSVTLAGAFGGAATSATWTTSGDGSFDNATSNAAIYTPGVIDISNGTVTLTFTTNDPAGPCLPVNDNVVITINATPVVDAGATQTICSGSAAALAGTIGGSASSATWTTSGDGTFDDATSLTATYTPGTADAGAGSVTLTLTTDDPSGPCVSSNDNVVITIEAGPTVDAGPTQSICSGGSVTLAGSFGGTATSAAWTTSGDGSFDDATSSTAVYTPGPTDNSNGSVTLTFTSDDPAGACTAVADNVLINIFSSATVDAGAAQTICSGGSATLAGSFTGTTGITWTTGGDGSFDDPALFNAVYTPGPNDITAGTVTLTITTGGPCAPVNDDVVITINDAPTVDAGAPQTICSSAAVVLNASFGGSATGLLWSSSGDGSFDDNTDVNASYLPGPNDAANGSVTLTATATGSCAGTSDNVVIAVNAAATLDAGNPQTACDGSAITLDATIGGSASSMTWTTSGDGTFDDNTNPDAQYTPGSTDVASGTVTLTATTNNPAGPCPAVSDNIMITFNVSVTTMNANACQNGAPVDLLSLVSGTPAGGTFTFTGPGVTGTSFDPSAQSGTVSISVDYDISGCTDNGTLQITILSPSDPLCGGGDCSSVVIVPQPEPATCTNSDGRLVMSIEPATPAVNNTGVKITIDGVSSTNLPISRTQFNNNVFEGLPVGRYDYTIEYGDPSCVKTGMFSIDQSGTVGTPVVSNIVSPTCAGTATGSLTLDVPGETGNVLEWSLDGGLSDPFKSFTAGGQITGLPAGPAPTYQHVISVRRNAADVCYSSVTVPMSEAVTAVSATFDVNAATCNGNDGAITNITAEGGHGGAYSFSIDGGQSFQTLAEFSGLAGGAYTLRIRDNSGCERDYTANVTFPGFINSAISKSNADCSNDGNSGAISVTVNDPGVFQVALTTDQMNPPADASYITYTNPAVSFTQLPRGEYFVYLKSGNAGCPTRSAPINIFGVYDVSFALEADCNNNELSFALVNITGEVGGADLDIHISKKLSSDPPLIIQTPLPADGEVYLDYDTYAFLRTPGEYRVQIIQFQSEAACSLASDIIDFTVPVPLSAGIGPVAESYPDVPSGKLSVVNFTGGVYPYNVRIELDSASSFSLPYYQTDFEEAGLNSNEQIEMSYDEIPAGRYIVQVQDSLGCVLDLTARVPLDVDLYIPNVFTPNGDGSNEVFFIRNLPQEGSPNELVITNRWGKEVFISENYQNDWDGSGAADGIYFYRLQVSDDQSLTGWLEIIRGPKP